MSHCRPLCNQVSHLPLRIAFNWSNRGVGHLCRNCSDNVVAETGTVVDSVPACSTCSPRTAHQDLRATSTVLHSTVSEHIDALTNLSKIVCSTDSSCRASSASRSQKQVIGILGEEVGWLYPEWEQFDLCAAGWCDVRIDPCKRAHS